jgi:hypothetical protein
MRLIAILPVMGKRLAIGAAWWLAVAYFWEFSAAMYGWPRTAGPLVALLAAGIVLIDPRDMVSRVRSRRIARRRDAAPGLATKRAVTPNA